MTQESARRHPRTKRDAPCPDGEASGSPAKERQESSEQHESQPDGSEAKSLEQILKRLSSDPDQGLSDKEAARRLEEHGPNAIEEEKRNPVLRLLQNFWGPIPWMLEVAIVLAAFAQRWEDLAVIAAMLLINGGVSFWHENKAQNAIEALKEQLAPHARAIRDGRQKTIEARELVPGDVIALRMGDVVPADVRLLVDQNLSIDESALTGESLPVEKEGGDGCYSGTTIKRGEARALVSATGAETKFARTVELVETAEESSHFRRAVLRIGYFLIGATLVLVATIVAVGWWRGDPWTELLMFALVLTIAGIPQALPAVLTVTMTVGASRIAQMKAIVSRLAAMEEMAGLHVLCADKTGTLTRNQLELQDPAVVAARDADDLVLAAALTTRRDGDDPIDKAILAALEDQSVLDDYEVSAFEPFDPTRKRAEAEVRHAGTSFRVAKGAPQVILDLVEAGENQRREIAGKVEELGERGFRALGVARRENGTWQYLGILPLLDPPREDSAEVLRDAREHGIDVRMVTGDHAAIAKQVAGQVGLGQNIPEATGLFAEETGEVDQRKKQEVLDADGFAQVTPEHKFNIIRHFQAGDRIVGMTGDGVNDAPALKQADVGIAVADATDAARAASDLVLTEQGLGVMVRAVEEARRIFERMVVYATFRITESTRVLAFVALSILAFDIYPVTPIMIVLLAILNDIPIMTIATDNVPTASHPVRWDMRRVLAIAAVLGIAGVGTSFLLYWYARTQMGLSTEATQTLVFLKLLVAGHLTIFLTRNEGWLWQRPWPSLPLFVALEGTQIAGTLIAIFGFLVHPISWQLALAVWGYALVSLLIVNALKVQAYVVLDHFWPRRHLQGLRT